MALTNIELYEALKRDLSEDSARMIAEVVPGAGDLMTKTDGLTLKSEMLAMEARLSDRFVSAERRFFMWIALPLWGAVAAGIVRLFIG